jgi:hypothetical protein
MFPILRHLVQTLPHGGNYQTHSSIWLRDLGVELVIDGLGQVGGGPDPTSQAYHPLEADGSTAHYSGRVWFHPFRLEVIFCLVSFLRRVRSFRDSTIRRERYPYLALCSSEALASNPPQAVHVVGSQRHLDFSSR